MGGTAKQPEDRESGVSASRRLRAGLNLSDAELMAQCVVEIHRASGPGGQHRNKVATAVRLKHRPSGFVVTATERRSQQENRAMALKRLREAIAVGVRAAPPDQIVWPPSVQIHERRLRVSPANPGFWQVLALVLDELAAQQGQVRRAAQRLGVTTSSLTRFLADHPKAWAEANRIRAAAGLSALRASR
jgi:hypothetical protein